MNSLLKFWPLSLVYSGIILSIGLDAPSEVNFYL